MYVLIVYDVEEKRVAKVLKFLRKYLNWIQNSVFEGEVTEAQLTEIKMGLKKITNKEQDSIIIFKARNQKWLNKEIMGKEKNPITNFLD
ncbi:CRISPR-associated endonuclease Cas2 [Defluviitalea raffinosedens]|jgi:CRISPR-associated protein Cas2|uniref:CRISPR-associated endoribonuclease Cas2 n=1 Tax=Defluviitalea raffinosedens TaxID=1450156 RepID=A0A7C8LSS7_9FIRM|nr:CRISPR-associated endonuclease Cas2 [Defluviitalea raffinosedens]KAE9633427.1 CRISPR-associated endonuclease Cas2 [Defluviitalea raffinosedens]MBM7687162.1 CRISPR-associated protein Cas2 [Defluviitalea raffinosedens]HHW67419.1 CRISPR-associated endonuclease Cas2 [Candidatus Epulonipiscium sp.]